MNGDQLQEFLEGFQQLTGPDDYDFEPFDDTASVMTDATYLTSFSTMTRFEPNEDVVLSERLRPRTGKPGTVLFDEDS